MIEETQEQENQIRKLPSQLKLFKFKCKYLKISVSLQTALATESHPVKNSGGESSRAGPQAPSVSEKRGSI
jgi:hypothetical protein